jgi:hypothetical protein
LSGVFRQSYHRGFVGTADLFTHGADIRAEIINLEGRQDRSPARSHTLQRFSVAHPKNRPTIISSALIQLLTVGSKGPISNL